MEIPKELAKMFSPKVQKDNMIQTDYATLFIIGDDEPLMLPVPAEKQAKVGASQVPVNGALEDSSKDFVLYYTDFAHEGSEMDEIYQTLREEADDNSDLTTRIQSGGGGVFEGMRLADLAAEVFPGRHTTVLENFVASMGAMTFAIGDTRIAYEFSSFMLHDYQSWCYGSGGNQLRQAEHYNKFIDSSSKRVLVDSGFITEKEFEMLKYGAELYYETPEMVLRGIATHVIVRDVLLTGDEFLEYYDSGCTIDEFLDIKKELAEAEEDDNKPTFEEIAEMLADGTIKIEIREE